MSKPSIYLAGPITGLSYGGAVDWREAAIAELEPDIIGLSPMRGKNYLEGLQSIGDGYEQFPLSTQAAITARDRFDVQRCDLVLFNMLGAPKASIATGSLPTVVLRDGSGNPVAGIGVAFKVGSGGGIVSSGSASGSIVTVTTDASGIAKISGWIGTCIELGWADAFRKPAVLVIEPEGNIHDHSMVRQVCGWRASTLEQGLAIARAVLLP